MDKNPDPKDIVDFFLGGKDIANLEFCYLHKRVVITYREKEVK